MIAYRNQYEPMDRMIVKMAQQGKLGPLREFIAGNSQYVGDSSQWRLKKALAGGGALPDIGLYALNAARFLSGQEPFEAMATTTKPDNDPNRPGVAVDKADEICSARFPAMNGTRPGRQGPKINLRLRVERSRISNCMTRSTGS
jgi:predicted dehydrogenase